MSISNTQTPFSQYGILTGQLFLYAQGRAAFESPPFLEEKTQPKKCILLGGLSDGLCPVPYTRDLNIACNKRDWSLVQPITSSSYTGFGHGSLARDCQELEELMQFLIDYRNAEEFALVGHSTGCQDAVYFLEKGKPELRGKLKLVALQAPVSDRESTSVSPPENFDGIMSHARTLIQDGKGQEMMPRSAFWAPITAQRFLDLNEKGGADDYFSSDYTDEELVARLGHISGKDQNKHLKVLVAFSGLDEYVPFHIDRLKMTERLVNAMNANCSNDKRVALPLYLASGNHNLSNDPKDGKVFVDKFAELLNTIGL
jgi:hypothetical protein